MPKTIRLAGLVEDSIVDGPGIRLALFSQGCLHKCPGCHNPETHDVNGGYLEETNKIIEKVFNNPLCSGITFSGGDPILQVEPVLEIAKAVKEKGKNTILYTGYLFEDLLKKSQTDSNMKALLENLDYIIDGPFILAKRDLTLHFKGSSNQRTIDVQKSLDSNQIVLADW